MKLLLIGARGQVGYELRRTLSPLATLTCTVRAAPQAGEVALDLCDPRALRAVVDGLRPDVIVNAAAYTAVDAAESDAAAARSVNADAVAVLAALAAAHSSLLVHYSTDYVFDGEGGSGPRPPPGASTRAGESPVAGTYMETDACRPLGVYGQSKRAGEEAVLALAGRAPHLVLRTGWVYGGRGRNFSLTMQRLAAGEGPIAVVADQFGTPTWSRLIAMVTGYLVARFQASPAAAREAESGLYHLCAPDYTSWHGFARHIIERAAGAARAASVAAIDTAQYPVPAPRPAWSVMHPGRLHETFGLALPPWRTQFDWMFEEGSAPRAASGV